MLEWLQALRVLSPEDARAGLPALAPRLMSGALLLRLAAALAPPGGPGSAGGWEGSPGRAAAAADQRAALAGAVREGGVARALEKLQALPGFKSRWAVPQGCGLPSWHQQAVPG
jgi:hypothetical protein